MIVGVEYVCPQKIYKYSDYNGVEKTLENQTVKFSRPTDLNDPFDISIQAILGLELDDFLSSLKERMVDHLLSSEVENIPIGNHSEAVRMMQLALRTATPEMVARFREELIGTANDEMWDLDRIKKITEETQIEIIDHYKNSGVFCTTINPLNLLMWAHYADQHMGAVLELSPSVEKDSAFLMSKPVIYSEQRPMLYRDVDDLLAGQFEFGQDEKTKFHEAIVQTKSPVWSYEEEYRLVIPNYVEENTEQKLHRFHPEELTSIILGHRMTEDKKNHAIELARAVNPAVKIKIASPDTREYKLVLTQIT